MCCIVLGSVNVISVITGQLVLSQLVPIFGQLLPVFWSTRTYFGQFIPSLVNWYLLKKEIVDGQRSR